MRKLTTAVLAVAFVGTGMALPLAASAATHPAGKHHHPHGVKNAPCAGFGIDLAIGSENICVPL